MFIKYVKIFIILIVLSVLVLPSISSVHADEKPIYGINCGIPSKPGAEKCCVENFDDIKGGEPKEGGENPVGKVTRWFTERAPFVGKLFKKKHRIEDELASVKETYGASVNTLCGQTSSAVAIKEEDANGNITSCTCVDKDSPEGQKYGLMPGGRLPGRGHRLPGSGLCNSGYYDGRDPAQVKEKAKCQKCIDKQGYWSALGCISFDFGTLLSTLIIDIGLLIGSVVVIACITFNAFVIQVSRGDAQKLQKARETIVSCILGLILIIFSVFILKIIGYAVGDIFDFKIDSIL